jgi:serine phosphatase RsbU (regulator of sigma subunit)
VLFVDDDPKILAALRRQFRKKIDVETVPSGADGLDAIRTHGPFSVVVTDYCMPEMNGIEFLKQVQEIAPETVRVLLTGSADLNAAIQAVNQGNIFRFLSKPCSPEALTEALLESMKRYRRSKKERKFNERTRRWLTEAMHIQQSMMPRSQPGVDGVDFAGQSIFCDQTGGDYYDYFEIGSGAQRCMGIVVGDVSDHGLPSALLMTSARAFLRESATRGGSISSIVGSVNCQLSRDIQASGRFMTLFYAQIDQARESIRWVRAGHDPGMLYDRCTDRFEELAGQGGLPLGVFEEAVYEEYQRRLAPGQILVIGTDGIWEARNDQGLMFGKQMLQKVIREHAESSSAQIVQQVLGSLTQFLFPLSLQDDATLVVVKIAH